MEAAQLTDTLPPRGAERLRQSRHTARMSRFTGGLIAAILVLQCGVIGWLPRQLERHGLWGKELARERIKGAMDHLRGTLRGEWPAASDAAMAEATRRVLEQELDRLARYLRENIDRMDDDQLAEIYNDLLLIHEILAAMEAGTLYPPMPAIRPEAPLRRLIGGGGSGTDGAAE